MPGSTITLSSRLVAVTDAELRRDHGITGRDCQLLHHLSTAPRGLTVGELARTLMRRAAPGHVDGVRHRVIEPLDRADLATPGRITGVLVDHLRHVDPVGD